MSAPGYDNYKASGVEWLDDVPSHWRLAKLRYLADFVGGGTPSRDKPEFWGGELPWVSPKDMKTELILGAQESITEEGLAGSSSSLIEPGAVLMVVRSGILQHTIPVAQNVVPVALNQDMKALRFSTECSPAFFVRWVQGLNDQLLLAWAKQGATVESIEQAYLADSIIPLPPPAEQAAIAAFLDRETGKIDALVEAQTRLIELLKEKRQAVISHAVTKGLDPAAPMKDSGVAWLGQVPAHWEVSRLKFVARIQTGVAKGKTYEQGDTCEVPYLRVANVQDGWIDLTDVATIELPAGDIDRYRLQVGDVLMNEGGDFDKLGRGAVWDGAINPCVHQNHVFSVRPVAVSPEWLDLTTSSSAAQFFFKGRSKQCTNLASISSTNVMELPVLVPSADEQASIVDHVVRACSKLDDLMSGAAAAITLLQERRAALISAAVTGKIDVREAAPRNNVVSLDSVRRAPNGPSLPAVVGAYAIRELGAMGRMPVMKAAYLAEGHAGLSDLRGRYERRAAGPYDRSLISAMERGAWEICNIVTHEPREEDRPVTYEVPKACQLPAEALSALVGGNRAEKFLAMLSLLKGIGRDGVEAVATIYAVWNDLLAAGTPADDNAICNGVLNDWDPEKSKKFTRADLDHWLAWMRRNGLEADGSAPRTDHQGSLFA